MPEAVTIDDDAWATSFAVDPVDELDVIKFLPDKDVVIEEHYFKPAVDERGSLSESKRVSLEDNSGVGVVFQLDGLGGVGNA